MKSFQSLFLLFAGTILFASSCIKDDISFCPNYLTIKYDYNMEFVDLFHQQVTFLSVFMFDVETGKFVRETRKEVHGTPEETFRMEVPAEWFGSKYDIVVWAGLDPDSYEFPTLTPGSSSFSDFLLKVKDYEKQLVERDTELEPLWHGALSGVTFNRAKIEEHAISLRKDTRKFRMVVQSVDENYVVETKDLDIRILSSGGWYDNTNNVLDPKERGITYLPYYTADDAEVGVIAEINSMQLLDDSRVNRLLITDKNSETTILDISLMKYLNALRMLEYSNMSFQEYLDREDEYYFLIYLQKVKDPSRPEAESWLAFQIMINDWIIRFQDIDK